MHKKWVRFISCLLLSILLCLGIGFSQAGYSQASVAKSREALIQAGLEQYHQGNLTTAIEFWQQSLSRQTQSEISPQWLDVKKYLARAYRQLGQMSEAIGHLTDLATYYRQVDDKRQLGHILVEQAQIYDELGQPQNAIARLCGETAPLTCAGEGALSLAQHQSDRLGEAAALGVLGQTYYLQGEYDSAINVLQNSLTIATAIDQKKYQVAALNTLGNVYTSLSQRSERYAQFAKQAQDLDAATNLEQTAQASDQTAIDYFFKSLELSQLEGDGMNMLRSQLNLILPLYRQEALAQQDYSLESETLLRQAQSQLRNLPDTREKAYIAIRLANLVSQVQAPPNSSHGFAQCSPIEDRTVELLQQSVIIARNIQDRVAESFAIGWLGHLYECVEDYPSAQQLTEQALLLTIKPESRYLWEWQLGRVFKAKGESTAAIRAYEQTVKTLKQVEGDIAIANRDLRLDFRDAVEGIYRQLTELQLQQALDRDQAAQPPMLLSAMATLDNLRLAELRNYLGSGCDLSSITSFSQASSPNTATLNTLILDNQLAVVLTLPTPDNQWQTTFHQTLLTKPELIAQVNEFRNLLEQRADRTNGFLPKAQEIYDWLIRPFESELVNHNIQTLAFNHDGIFRSIPMAALHDGQRFLVETYAITNGSNFSSASTADDFSKQSAQVLAFGLTTPARVAPTEQFPALAAVAAEIKQIESTLPGSSVFLDEMFTQQRLQSELENSSASILHIATHAKFGYDSNDTFLITGEKTADTGYNQLLSMNELYQLIRQLTSRRSSLKLLTLTACETAAGSERDALGLAGVAVQAGVESAIASLWQVDDLSTAELSTHFYQYLQQGFNRSNALQMAQKDWLKNQNGRYQHPGYWAALVLIGNGM